MTQRRPRLLFYDDAAHFGGHEAMALTLIEQLARQARHEIVFIASRANAELCRRLEQIAPGVTLLRTGYASGRGQWLRSYVSAAALLRLVRRLRGQAPDLLVVVQGGVALSSLGVLAGRLAGVRTISYLPMTHDESLWTRSAPMARLRQACVRPFYALPQVLVTISARMAAHAARHRRGPVRVVENGIVPTPVDAGRRHALRAELGLGDDEQLLLMVGRVEFWQKRHDLALQALALARSRGLKAQLLVVGSGPDDAALRALVKSLGLEGAVHCRGWQTDVGTFYAACDTLLLPSRYEGVPLVMLEAMHAGRRIVAADVDGMADMLPPRWTFAAGDAQALADALCAAPDPADDLLIERHREQIATRHSVDAFCKRFQSVIDEQLDAAGKGSTR